VVTRFLTSLLPLALLLLPADARAQDWAGFYDRQTLVYWHGQTPPGIEENFREVVWPKLLPDEKRKLSRVTLDFPLEDARQLMNFYAVWGGGKQTITLPISSIRFLADIVLAEAWLGVSGYSTDPVTDYLAMLKYQWPDRLAGRRYRPREALGIPDDATANPRVERRFQRDFGTAIVFVLGHELGHLYYQHGTNVSLERSRQQEEEADRFAMELMRRIGEAGGHGAILPHPRASRAVYERPGLSGEARGGDPPGRVGAVARHRRGNRDQCRGLFAHRHRDDDAGGPRRHGARLR
jgi:hypothetical protein